MRGINGEAKQKFVNRFLHTNNVGVYGLIETKIKADKVHKTMSNVFKDWSISTNNAQHQGGRIWVLQKPHMVDIRFLEYDAQYIHMQILDKVAQVHFHYTIVYAFNGVSEREPLWTNLRRLAGAINGPWAVGGDFSCVLFDHERLGGKVSHAEAVPFHDCLDSCHLIDNQALGAYYTWSNKQTPTSRKYSRLDKFLVNAEWMSTFAQLFAKFLPEGLFDHNPCVVRKDDRDKQRNRPFKYFNTWSSAPQFQATVTKVFEGTKTYKVIKKMKALKPKLKEINRCLFSDVENADDLAMTELLQLQKHLIDHPTDPNLLKLEYEAHQKAKRLQQAKGEYLRQKAKAHWFIEGDTNNAYFHGIIKAKRNKNTVHEIRDHKDRLYNDEKGIQTAFLEYYQLLLRSHSQISHIITSIVKQGALCTDQHKHSLMEPVTRQ
ncbi:uncharacterized protein LOC141614361 [Silene latifolia]|uniref:uncharacterized protein LOC141614361 n=1 Tax=Silene latifolia TaxID=37657 RepID=UPI003D77B1C8